MCLVAGASLGTFGHGCLLNICICGLDLVGFEGRAVDQLLIYVFVVMVMVVVVIVAVIMIVDLGGATLGCGGALAAALDA
ncbi:MAG: hypothetical protein ACXV5U_07690, partial [Ilumatobacteraceae bacterium]